VVHETEAQVAYLCTPNSPTGAHVSAEAVAAFAAEHPSCCVVLDQAFLSLSERFAEATFRFPANVVCVRSITKEHAIPGVRVGYLIAAPEVAAHVEAGRPAWTTSAMAQAAALAACGQERFVAESRTQMLADRDDLARGLRRVGLGPLSSVTAFVLVPVPDATALRRTLLVENRILIRDAASFGLPGFVRIAARPVADTERLLSALAALLPPPRKSRE
jgi:histidinol-phosphate/aromatic aminotransferase/cobyric acid decarboxylase-like protein